jgi:hypothetical protein
MKKFALFVFNGDPMCFIHSGRTGSKCSWIKLTT